MNGSIDAVDCKVMLFHSNNGAVTVTGGDLLHIEFRAISVAPPLNLAFLEAHRACIMNTVLHRNRANVLCRPNRYIDRDRQADNCFAEHFIVD